MTDSIALLSAERDRKSALRDSFERQLLSVGGQGEDLREELARLDQDMARLRPPSALLEAEREKLLGRERKSDDEARSLRSKINQLQKEILVLERQIKQLSE